tara:strand:- start:4715 stop:6142 length:1428 start_codon:yes stop_codon:yes gene_type:complete
MKIVLASSGLGIRMKNIHEFLPKSMYPYEGYPIIGHLINEYRKFSDDIIVTVSGDDKGKLLSAWLNDYYDFKITIHIQEKATGTTDLINSLDLVGQEVLISWSDFIFEDYFCGRILDYGETNFGIANIECRFSTENGVVYKSNSKTDGLFGLFYFDELPLFDKSTEDILDNYVGEEVRFHEYNIIPLGDYDNYITNGGNKKKLSWNNHVSVKGDKIIKTPFSGNDVLCEMDWYVHSPKKLTEHLPTDFWTDGKSISMEKCSGIVNDNGWSHDQHFWTRAVPELLENLHQEMVEVDKAECVELYLKKPTRRLMESSNILKCVDKNVKVKIGEFSEKVYGEIPLPDYFTWVHYDLTLSNMVVDNYHIKLIDPKGVFYGDPRYDIAKLFYSISGFEHIKNGEYSIHFNNGKWELEHGQYHSPYIDWFKDWSMEKYGIDKKTMNAMLAGIWLSACGFFLYDPMMVIACYLKYMELGRWT